MNKIYAENGKLYKESILKEMENQRNVYHSDNSRIISDYNNELETIREYNGRQVLELLQNADDEQSEEVLIELDTENYLLKIYNRGSSCTGFSAGGIKSLMVSNFSPKTTKKYIGNKGLGFRSIVNWSTKITINSQNIDVIFSKDIATKLYDELCDKEAQKKISEERRLPKDVKPIAFLSIPEIQDHIQHDYTTIIEVEFLNQYMEDIIKQIENISDEILLFVNHINKLSIKVDNKERTIEREKDGHLIYVNEKLWTIFPKSAELPSSLWDKTTEKENYELKLAIQETFDSSANFLHSYLPTKVNVDFPFIIHGTFDLNSSRNDLNDNPKNRYILQELVKLIIETATFLTNDEVSYKALEFLSHNSNNTTLENLGFYEEIDNSVEELEIFPCVDNQYRKKSEVVFSNDWAAYIINARQQHIIPNLLLPYDGQLPDDLDGHDYLEIKAIQKLSNNVVDIDSRVELIYLINETIQGEQFSLLVDKNNELIPLGDEVYTPITKDYDLNMPEFVRIKFINNKLYNKLIEKFEITSNEKPRDLQRELKGITNIQSYEPAQVILKIISSTNKELAKEYVDRSEVLKKMVFSLYENYKRLDDKPGLRETALIQLLSKGGDIVKTKELYLSKTFPSGELTELLFGDFFKENRFLADIETFGFNESEDIEDIENFFIWLGVNKHTEFGEASKDRNYEAFIFEKINRPHNFNRLTFNQPKIEYIREIAEEFSGKNQYDKFILWILSDKRIYTELITQKTLKYFYRTYYYLYNAPSYVLYQLSSSNIFTDYLITNENINALVNDAGITFNYQLLSKYNIKRQDVEGLILKIGAVDSFEELSIDAVRRVIGALPINAPDGKHALTIYKYSIDHYKKNGEPLDDDGIVLCAKKEGELGYHPSCEVYYNGNIKLPKKISDSVAVLNYPRRQSTNDVINFFGIKDLRSIDITIQKHTKIEALTQEFQNHLNKILPYILVYRFETSVTESSRKKDLTSVKNMNIHLCDQVEYEIGKEGFDLEDNDYIKDDKTYFIKVAQHKSFDKLRRELNFRDTFADIIGTIFDITDTDKFSRLMSDDIQETEMIIKRNVGNELINQANSYLGGSDEYHSFWNTVYFLIDREYNYNSDKYLLHKIKEDLDIATDVGGIDYKELNDINSCEHIERLFNELKINIRDFNNQNPYYRIDFSEYHNFKLKYLFNEGYYNFKQILYSWCLNNSCEKEFLNLLGKYEHNSETIDKNRMNVDYQKIVESYVESNFGFSLMECVSNTVDIEEIYEKNKSLVNFELVESSNECRSLLYFEGKIDEINKITEGVNETVQNEETKDVDDDVKPIVSVDLSHPPNIKPKNRSRKKPYKHSPTKDKEKKRSGDLAEKDVFDSLVREFGKENVVWVSKYNDSAGYDIRYKTKDGSFKYVEVKTYSNRKFYLTKNEKEFAESNQQSYEIFLVGDEIFKISDIDFSNDEQFNLIVNEFEVYYEINTHAKSTGKWS